MASERSGSGRPVPPHPSPLPRGEGATFVAPPCNAEEAAPATPDRRNVHPLPEGEGGGEGDVQVDVRTENATTRSPANPANGRKCEASQPSARHGTAFREVVHA